MTASKRETQRADSDGIYMVPTDHVQASMLIKYVKEFIDWRKRVKYFAKKDQQGW